MSADRDLMDRDECPVSLVGRAEDKTWLHTLLTAAVSGHGAAAVLRGDPGMGKTLLVTSAAAGNPELRLILLAGAEAETDLPYAALQRMVLAHRTLLDGVAKAERSALLRACGLEEGPPAAQLLVGLGLLSFLARMAAEAPLLCFIDDAQWIDPESLHLLAFAGRRVQPEPIALVFAVQAGTPEPGPLAGLPTRTLSGLDDDAARVLLSASSPRSVSRNVMDRIIGAAAGNPLALLDLPAALSEQQLRGEELLPDSLPLGNRLESHYRQQGRRLPQETQLWLLTAAAETDGNLHTITAASRSLGVRADASRAAELAGLVHVDGTVTFSHPFVRAALYNGAASHDLRTVHRHLAAAAENRGDTFRWALHRAAAAVGPDAAAAEELERAAGPARTPGGHLTRTDLLLRSAMLTPAGPGKDLRLLAAGESAIADGSGAQARRILRPVHGGRLDDVARGRLLLAQCELDIIAPLPGARFADRPQRLLTAAKLFHPAAPERAKQAVASVFWALVQADELVAGTSSAETAAEARRICELNPGADLPTRSLIALSTLILDGRAAAAPLVQRAVAQATAPQTPTDEVLGSYCCLAYAAGLLRDPDAGTAVLQRAEDEARNNGATLILCRILLLGAHLDGVFGRIRDGRKRLSGAAELLSVMGLPQIYSDMVTALPTLRGWSGTEAGRREEALTAEAAATGYGLAAASNRIGTMLLRASQGRYAEAWEAGRQLRYGDPFFSGALFLPDLVECAARAGDRAAAADLLHVLQSERQAVAGRPSGARAEGLMERSLAVVEDQDGAAPHFERALALFTHSASEMDAARTHLLYGEWLRRRRRRTAAARELAEAAEMFDRLDAPSWAERTRRELAALGAGPGPAKGRTGSQLTPQEVSVAELAAAGCTNAEIAARLFITANTVDYHLRKVFRKLGVTSRRQLRHLDFGKIPGH